MGRFQLQIPGRYNIYNALAATAAAWSIGISAETIRDSLASFKGTHRRFEVKGSFNDITVVDDYAHHPLKYGPPCRQPVSIRIRGYGVSSSPIPTAERKAVL